MAARPSDALTVAIQALHEAIAQEQDPGHVAILSQCLTQMTKVQRDIMQPSGGGQGGPAQGGGAQQAVLQQLAGRG